MKIHDAFRRLGLQQFKKRNNFAMSIERHFLPEVNEERLVAGGLKPNICGKEILHCGESISHVNTRQCEARLARKSPIGPYVPVVINHVVFKIAKISLLFPMRRQRDG